MPDRLQRQTIASLVPHCARKVPKVDWLAVRDEEGLAVNPLCVDRNGWQELVCGEKGQDSEDVSVSDVLNICEVEEVVVVTDLVLGLSVFVSLHHLGEQLHVTLAKDARRTNGAGKEALWRAVRFEYVGLGIRLAYMSVDSTCSHQLSAYLRGGVVLGLSIARNQRPLLVGIDKLSISTKDDTRRAGVNKSLDTRVLRRLQQVLGAFDIDLVVNRRRQIEVG